MKTGCETRQTRPVIVQGQKNYFGCCLVERFQSVQMGPKMGALNHSKIFVSGFLVKKRESVVVGVVST